MGIPDRLRRDRPMSDAELDERSQVDGIKYRDLQIVGQLTQVGANLKSPRDTVFYLYFPAEVTATAGGDALRGDCGRVRRRIRRLGTRARGRRGGHDRGSATAVAAHDVAAAAAPE